LPVVGWCITGKKCIAYLVCQEMNIPERNWAFCKDVVRESIRIRRANCNAALKKEYHGKYYVSFVLGQKRQVWEEQDR